MSNVNDWKAVQDLYNSRKEKKRSITEALKSPNIRIHKKIIYKNNYWYLTIISFLMFLPSALLIYLHHFDIFTIEQIMECIKWLI